MTHGGNKLWVNVGNFSVIRDHGSDLYVGMRVVEM